MRRPSKFLEELEDKLVQKCGPWFDRHKKRFPVYIPLGLTAWYFYGMFLNSLKLGTALTFCPPGETPPESIWVLNPFKNWFVLLTPFGLGVTAVVVLLICLITKKGYIWFSGYKYTHDSRGFDILPDATHGSSGFLTKKEMAEFLELGLAREVKGMMLGKVKARPETADKYAAYAAHRMVPGDNNNLLCIGAPGSGKSRGFIIPFMLGCAQRGESIFITDPKAEFFEKMSPYFKEHGYCVRAVNFLAALPPEHPAKGHHVVHKISGVWSNGPIFTKARSAGPWAAFLTPAVPSEEIASGSLLTWKGWAVIRRLRRCSWNFCGRELKRSK